MGSGRGLSVRLIVGSVVQYLMETPDGDDAVLVKALKKVREEALKKPGVGRGRSNPWSKTLLSRMVGSRSRRGGWKGYKDIVMTYGTLQVLKRGMA